MSSRFTDMPTRAYRTHNEHASKDTSIDAIAVFVIFLAGVAIGMLLEKRWAR